MRIAKFMVVLLAALAMQTIKPSSARGQGYVMNFEFSHFPTSNFDEAPTDPVTGSLLWQAANINGPIQRFDVLNLTLDGHTYSLNDIHYEFQQNPGSSMSEIYSNPNGPFIDNLTDGFFLVWDHVSLQPFAFGYTSSQRSGIWSISAPYNPSSFDFFSITQVPEPSTMALGALGAAVLLIFRRQKGPNHSTAANPAMTSRFHAHGDWRRVADWNR